MGFTGQNRRTEGAAGRALAVGIVLMAGSIAGAACRAQELSETSVIDEPAPPEISREAWRERVMEARRRAKATAAERRANPQLYVAIPEDPERVATERVLNDDSLQRGDIVSTKNGLFVFQGRGDQPRRTGDFVALPSR